MSILEVEHISKSFNKTEALKDISFSLERGQVLSIIGSSGSGKTTLLRCLNFLETPDRGIIRVNGETLFDADNPAAKLESVIRKKRLHFGLVFQSFNLFPQYTALQNVMLAKELLAREQPDYKTRKKEIYEEIRSLSESLLSQMGLEKRKENYPHQLSGGQCQRVAIARALALNPDILCFDEPTSALDPEMVGEVLELMKQPKYLEIHPKKGRGNFWGRSKMNFTTSQIHFSLSPTIKMYKFCHISFLVFQYFLCYSYLTKFHSESSDSNVRKSDNRCIRLNYSSTIPVF